MSYPITIDLDELTRRYQLIASDMVTRHHDALTAKIAARWPTALSFGTMGQPDEEGEIKIEITYVRGASDDENTLAATFENDIDAEQDFYNETEEHLMWLGGLSGTDYLGGHDHPIPRYRYVKLCAVLRLLDSYDPAEDIQLVLPANNAYGDVMFAATDPGYNGEFEALGADPTSWSPADLPI